mgnify:CR=1 FL=1
MESAPNSGKDAMKNLLQLWYKLKQTWVIDILLIILLGIIFVLFWGKYLTEAGILALTFWAILLYTWKTWQLKDLTAEQLSFNTRIEIVKLLQDQGMRDARRALLEMREKENERWKDLAKWTENEKKQAEMVCGIFNIIGTMVIRNAIQKELVLEWDYPIVRCWEAAEPMVSKYRHERQAPDYWKNFELLYGLAKKYRREKIFNS